MQNELLKPHSISQLFSLAFRIYRSNLIPLLVLYSLLVIPPFIAGFAGMQVEQPIMFMVSFFGEAGVTIGVLTLMFRPVFPTFGILYVLRSRFSLGVLTIGLLHLMIVFVSSNLIGLPAPIGFIFLFFLLFSFYAFPLATTCYVVDGVIGSQALKASFQLVQSQRLKTLLVLFLAYGLKFIFSLIIVSTIAIDANMIASIDAQGQNTISLEALYGELRWTLYLGFVVVGPFIAIVLTLLFFDLKSGVAPLSLEQIESRIATLLGAPSPTPSSEENE